MGISLSSDRRAVKAPSQFAGLLAAILLAVSLSTSSCVGRGSKGSAEAPAPPKDPALPVKSESIDLHFYLDASASMRGFLASPKTGQKNYFTNILRDAGNVLGAAWDGNFTFWRFGDGEPRQLEDDDIRAFMRGPAFGDQFTHIERAIGHRAHGRAEPRANLAQVKVIVTDLMQNGEEARSLAKLLDDNFLNQEPLAVGVLGVRNAFHGKVDVPANPQEADSLPFYLLIAGKAPDVRFTIDRLVRGFRIADADYFELVFTRQMVSSLTQEIEIASASGGGFTLDDRRVQVAKDLHIPVLTNVRKDLTLTVSKRMDGKAGEARLEPDYLNSNAHLKLHTRSEVKAFRSGQNDPDSRAKDAVTLKIDPKSQAHQITINRSMLDSKALYLFQIDMIGDWDHAVSSMEQWDLDSPDVKFPEDAKGFRQGRTLNLMNFLNVLLLKMGHYQTPLVRYCFYVETR